MKEFMLIFRNQPPSEETRLSPEQLQNISKPWQDWIGGIAAQNKLSSLGARLDFEGTTVRSNIVTDGPYAEVKEILLGYIVVKVGAIEEAIELSKECPVLNAGGSVEVRGVVPMNI
jgi:hypothetical protein